MNFGQEEATLPAEDPPELLPNSPLWLQTLQPSSSEDSNIHILFRGDIKVEQPSLNRQAVL